MSRAFRFLIGARRRLYDSGLLEIRRLNHPVISVGNLTTGGTGKTPLVIALAARLLSDGFRPVVLSRGYRRMTSGVVVVSEGAGPTVPWADAGDEPYLIARRVPRAAVVVGADRYEAGRLAEQRGLGDIFILDDGFQHRRLHRDFDLITIDPVEWAAGERLLPAGPWREPKTALSRAHAACIQTNPDFPTPTLNIPAFTVETVIEGIYRGDEHVPVEAVRGRAIVAFAGIAKPERFFEALERLGLAPVRRIRFRDHHAYSRRELENLGGEMQITTEKDAVRLEAGLPGFLHLRISAKIPDFDGLMSLIQGRLRACS